DEAVEGERIASARDEPCIRFQLGRFGATIDILVHELCLAAHRAASVRRVKHATTPDRRAFTAVSARAVNPLTSKGDRSEIAPVRGDVDGATLRSQLRHLELGEPRGDG